MGGLGDKADDETILKFTTQTRQLLDYIEHGEVEGGAVNEDGADTV